MDYKEKIKFYEISLRSKRGEALIELDLDYEDHPLRLGKMNIESTVFARIDEGKKLYDILRFQDPVNFAISSKVKNELEANQITGWKVFDIKVKDVNDSYFGFQILGRSGSPKQPENAGIVHGFEFDLSLWDGSDIFCPQGMAMPICTEEGKKVLASLKIPTLEFNELSTLEWYSIGRE